MYKINYYLKRCKQQLLFLKKRLLVVKVFSFTMFFLFLFGSQLIVSAYVYKYDFERHTIISDVEFERYVFNGGFYDGLLYSSLLSDPIIISQSSWEDKYLFLEKFNRPFLLLFLMAVVFLDTPLAHRKLWGGV